MNKARIWRPRALALAGCLAGAAAAQVIPQDAAGFTEHVAARLRREAPAAAVTVKGPLTLGLDALQVNLERVFAFCRRGAAECDREIDATVKGAAQVLTERNAPPSRAAVRMVVRSARYAQQAQRALPAGAPGPQPQPFVADLVLLPVLDSPRSLRLLTTADNTALGLAPDAAHRLALANLRATLKPLMEVAAPATRGRISQLAGDTHHTSRLALPDTWAPLAEAQGGTLVVAAPASDLVLYVAEDTPPALDALRKLAAEVVSHAPNALSGALLRWRAGAWEEVK